METVLDLSYFNHLNDAFLKDDPTALENEYFGMDVDDDSIKPLFCRESFYMDMKGTGTKGSKKRTFTDAMGKTEQRVDTNDKTDFTFKPFPFESEPAMPLYEEDIQTLDDVFLSDIFQEKPSVEEKVVPPTPKRQKKTQAKIEPAKDVERKSAYKLGPKRQLKTSSKKTTIKINLKKLGKVRDTYTKQENKNVNGPNAAVGELYERTDKESKENEIGNGKKRKIRSKVDRNALPANIRRPRNRMKWSRDENLRLWESISRHGNNWTEIKKDLASRTYYQIKDKGRRLLSVQGWISGRNKKYSHEAMYSAKVIAQTVLARKLQGSSNESTTKTE